MQIRQLTTRSFRNLADVSLAFHPRFNVIAGDNAQGKTNLLEAIDLVLGQRPFRASRTTELVRFGAESAAITATVCHDDMDHDVRLRLGAGGRSVQVDGKPLRGAVGWPHGITSVLFTPDDLFLPKGPPSDRRRLLDRAVASVWPTTYNSLLRAYTRALSSRNRVLRDRPAVVGDLLDVYDAQLAPLGAKITSARARYVRALQPDFEDAYRFIDGDRPAQLSYISASLPDSRASVELDSLRQSLADQLRASRETDLARRVTTSGPHQDDLLFALDGRSARTHASQGQVRTLVLAFKIAQINHTAQILGHYPPLLLDDVSSELDPKRNECLFSFIDQISSQLFVTTTRPELIPVPPQALHLTVMSGEISSSSPAARPLR